MYPCRSKDGYCKLEIPLDNLPLCQNKAELECFLKSKWASKKEIGRENLFKPCTLIQYKSVGTTWYNPKRNKAIFRMTFHKPPRVTDSQRGILDLWIVDHDWSGWWYIGSLLDSHLMIYSKEFGAHVQAKSGSFYTGKKLINRTRNCVSLRFYPGIHIKDPNLVLSGAVFFLKIDML